MTASLSPQLQFGEILQDRMGWFHAEQHKDWVKIGIAADLLSALCS